MTYTKTSAALNPKRRVPVHIICKRRKRLLAVVNQLSPVQGKRLEKLKNKNNKAFGLAEQGIVRHVNACYSIQEYPDSEAIRQIIDEALEGRAAYSD